MSDGKIIQENGENIMPITHETCVLDDEGNPITETIGDVSLLSTESRNLVGAVNEVFGDIIKEQVVDSLVDNGVEASANEPWSGLIEKIDNIISKNVETRDALSELMQNGGYNINGDEDIDSLLDILTTSGIKNNEIKRIFGGYYCTFILKNTGELLAVGENTYIGLGISDKKSRSAFTSVTDNVENVFCGLGHSGNSLYGNTFILKKDGSLWACGDGYNGQLGLGVSGNNSRYTPLTQVITNVNNDVKLVASGANHAFLLKNDGSVWACGNNYNGQLGLGDTTNRSTFTQVTTNVNNDVKQIACGFNNCSYILKNDGTIWFCGNNSYGQMGTGSSDSTNHTTFTQINGINDIKDIAYSKTSNSLFMLKNDNSLWVYGYNANGELGIGNATNKFSFTQSITNVKQFSCGAYHTFVMKDDGSIWGTGQNTSGQLGLNHLNGIYTFTEVVDMGKDNKQLVCGNYHTCVLKDDGTVWTCGQNGFGQLGVGIIDNTSNNYLKVFTKVTRF